MSLRAALIQMNSGSDMAANIAALETLVAEAAGKGAQLVATPENTFYMGGQALTPALSQRERELWSQDDHPGIQAASALAKKYAVWLLIGSVAVLESLRAKGEAIQSGSPRSQEAARDDGKKTYNRSILFSPEGAITATYDKIHLFDVEIGDGQSYRESDRMLAGERAVLATVSPSPFQGEGRDEGRCHDAKHQSEEENPHPSPLPKREREFKLGLTICYDLRFPHLYRSLAKAGANILAVPAAFTAKTGAAHWHVLLRARAIENGCFVIAPAQCGTHPGERKTYGHSLVVDPWGEIIAERTDDTPGVLMAEIDLDKVAKVRAGLPSLVHDREFS